MHEARSHIRTHFCTNKLELESQAKSLSRREEGSSTTRSPTAASVSSMITTVKNVATHLISCVNFHTLCRGPALHTIQVNNTLSHLADSGTRVSATLLIRVSAAGYFRAFQCKVAGAVPVDQTTSKREVERICGC